MDLQQAKYVSMIVLFLPNLLVTLVGIYIEKYVRQRNVQVLEYLQRIISCLTSGIFLGKSRLNLFGVLFDRVV